MLEAVREGLQVTELKGWVKYLQSLNNHHFLVVFVWFCLILLFYHLYILSFFSALPSRVAIVFLILFFKWNLIDEKVLVLLADYVSCNRKKHFLRFSFLLCEIQICAHNSSWAWNCPIWTNNHHFRSFPQLLLVTVWSFRAAVRPPGSVGGSSSLGDRLVPLVIDATSGRLATAAAAPPRRRRLWRLLCTKRRSQERAAAKRQRCRSTGEQKQ